MPIIRLTAAATSTMPRFLFLAITIVYGLVGLFGRDPWKNDDAIGFSIMLKLANSPINQWIFPHLEGREEILTGPLPYWIGGACINLFHQIAGVHQSSCFYSIFCFFLSCVAIWRSSYLLGCRKEVQPYSFALGGQPTPRDYGRTLADSALMIFLACIGLALKVHETTPALAQLLGISIILYGIVRGLDFPIQGGIWSALGFAILILSSTLSLFLFTFAGVISSLILCKIKLKKHWFFSFYTLLILSLLIWPITWIFSDHSIEQIQIFYQSWLGKKNIQLIPSKDSFNFFIRNIFLYSWPIWPLAAWSVFFWSKSALNSGSNAFGNGVRYPNIAIPSGILFFLLIYQIQQTVPSDQSFALIIPSMAILACFSLPSINRNIISFIDWFSMIIFTILGMIIWIMWIAMIIQFPTFLAEKITQKVPGFIPEFNIVDIFFAIIVTISWFIIVFWRTSHAPKAIWRTVVISASGTTLTWVLLMTLWLPTINYAKTYRQVAKRLMIAVPNQYSCIDTTYLGNSQLASFNYFTKLRMQDNNHCDLWLGNTLNLQKIQNNPKYKLIWSDHRESDKNEQLRLYQLK